MQRCGLTAASRAGSAVFAVLTFGKPFMPAIIERRREQENCATSCFADWLAAPVAPRCGVLRFTPVADPERITFRTENFQSFADVTNRAQCAMMLAMSNKSALRGAFHCQCWWQRVKPSRGVAPSPADAAVDDGFQYLDVDIGEALDVQADLARLGVCPAAIAGSSKPSEARCHVQGEIVLRGEKAISGQSASRPPAYCWR